VPFERLDIQEYIDYERERDPAFREAWDNSREEYRRIAELVQIMNKDGLSRAKTVLVNRYDEEDGSITLSTIDMDIVANGENLSTAKTAVASNLMEYAEEFLRESDLYGRDLNRRKHLPYIMRAIAAESVEELEEIIEVKNASYHN